MNDSEKKIFEKICTKHKIKFCYWEGEPSEADYKRREVYMSHEASLFIGMHEIAHVLCGPSCCRNHAEYFAHAGSLVLCHENNITIPENHMKTLKYCVGGLTSCDCEKKEDDDFEDKSVPYVNIKREMK